MLTGAQFVSFFPLALVVLTLLEWGWGGGGLREYSQHFQLKKACRLCTLLYFVDILHSLASFSTWLSLSVAAGLDGDNTLDDDEEKQRLISQVLELQNTLDGEAGE